MQQEQVPAGAWPGAWMDDQCRLLFVQLLRPILLAGEDILVDYGYSTDRQTRWGFGPKANLPFVKPEYAFQPQTKFGKYGETQIVS
jgi:hypothetical protein